MEINRANSTSFGMSLRVTKEAAKKISTEGGEYYNRVLKAAEDLSTCKEVHTTIDLAPNGDYLCWVERPDSMGGRFANPIANGEEIIGNKNFGSHMEVLEGVKRQGLGKDPLESAVKSSKLFEQLLGQERYDKLMDIINKYNKQ